MHAPALLQSELREGMLRNLSVCHRIGFGVSSGGDAMRAVLIPNEKGVVCMHPSSKFPLTLRADPVYDTAIALHSLEDARGAALHLQQLVLAPPPCTRRQLTAMLLDAAPGNPLALLAAVIACDPRWSWSGYADVLATRTVLEQQLRALWPTLFDAACLEWPLPLLAQLPPSTTRGIVAALPVHARMWLVARMTERACAARQLHALTNRVLAERAGWVVQGDLDRYAPTREHFHAPG